MKPCFSQHSMEVTPSIKIEIEDEGSLSYRKKFQENASNFIKCEKSDNNEDSCQDISTEFVDCKIETESDEGMDSVLDQQSEMEALHDIPTVKTRNPIEISKQGKKEKTEPANQFLQFLKFKREQLQKSQPGAKLDPKIVREEWKTLSVKDKQQYKDMTQKEKESLGDSYRKNRRKKVKKVPIAKLIGISPKLHIILKKTKKEQPTESKKQTTDNEMTLEMFLNESEKLDEEIEAAYDLKDKLKDQLWQLKIESALKNQNK